MPTTFIMRALDPNAGEYVYWHTDTYDALGASYLGPPGFATLEDVACILTVTTSRDDLFFEPFLPTQDRDETTPDHEGTCFIPIAQIPVEDGATSVPPTFPTQDRDETTPDHEGFLPDSIPAYTYASFPPNFTSSGVCVNEFYFPTDDNAG